MIITESWLRGDFRDDHILADITTTLPNYHIQHVHRHSRGGGICVIHRTSLKITLNDAHVFTTFEHMDLTIRISPSIAFRLCAIYRPPPSVKNKLTFEGFVHEFSVLLESVLVHCHQPLLIGDFNIQVDNVSNKDSKTFSDILYSAGLVQHVTVSTHLAGHTLDLVITRRDGHPILSTSCLSGLPSDHDAVVCSLNFARPPSSKKLIKCRKLKDINVDQFTEDLRLTIGDLPDVVSPSDLAQQYNQVVRDLVDKHAPEKTVLLSLRPNAPWHDKDVKKAKREKRRAERRWVKSETPANKELYREKCRLYNEILSHSKSSYLQGEIEKLDNKGLFQWMQKLTSPPSSRLSLPSHESDKQLANDFGLFFYNKIQTIVDKLDGHQNEIESIQRETILATFSEFHPVSEDDVMNVIN
ncbi:uncharacterized protein [Diadema setosum]|uniref:uncharacterized protein n=1 Tax=Diadema setosum TaxID=31175 RepID=UPI003B3AFA82